MEKILLSEIVKACDGSYGYPANTYITDMTTNSKQAKKGSVFIAIKGERFDAHDFVRDAAFVWGQSVQLPSVPLTEQSVS